MTIDEAIKQFEYDAECNRADLDLSYAKDNEQVAEWLEDYKHIKQWKSDIMDSFCKYDVSSFEELVANTRNKAIDDFVKFANTMPTVEEEDGTIRPMRLEEMAKHLKEQK